MVCIIVPVIRSLPLVYSRNRHLPEENRMNDSDVFEVVRRELHWLPDCPCDACVMERERRSRLSSFRHPLKSISVSTACALGFIKRRSPDGSLAKELMTRG